MVDHRVRRRPAAPAVLTAVVAGLALLTGCTSSPRPTPTSSSRSGTGATWSIATPVPSGGPATSGPTVTGGATPGGPTGPPDTGPASQSGTDARRDGIAPSVASLPLVSRIRQLPPAQGAATRAETTEGVWVVSQPEFATGSSTSPSGGYGEVLLLDPSGQQIRRAYPFLGLPPQWIVVTSTAIYCGRSGDAISPDAMVCRIDRVSGQLQVRVFADRHPVTATTAQELSRRPGGWVIDSQTFTGVFGRPPLAGPTALVFSAGNARIVSLDPATLQVLDS
jgi:hypothetical protein